MAGRDALLMGKNTYETVLSFSGDWPYSKPVFVLSNTLGSLPANLEGKVELVHGTIEDVLQKLNERGFAKLYIGGGIPLLGSLLSQLGFEHLSTRVLLDAIVQSHYRRVR